MKNDNRKSIRKVTAFIAYIVCIVFIVSFILNLVRNGENNQNNNNGFSAFGYWPIIVVTGSMEPTIQVNSISICQTVTIDELEVGDIVAFNYSNELITHRVIEKVTNESGETVIHTKGDNNASADTIDITANMVRGKVIKTWNSAAPIVSKYVIGPGEFNSVAIAQSFIWILVTIGIIAVIIGWLWGFIGTVISVMIRDKSYTNEIDNYIEDINSLIKYRDTLYELRDKQLTKEEHKNEIRFNRLAKARAIREIRLNSESVKDFNKAMKTVIRLNKFGKMLDKIHKNKYYTTFDENVKNFDNSEVANNSVNIEE